MSTVEIPPLRRNPHLGDCCSDHCHWMNNMAEKIEGTWAWRCRLGWHEPVGTHDCKPGPDCPGPGKWELNPPGTADLLQAAATIIENIRELIEK